MTRDKFIEQVTVRMSAGPTPNFVTKLNHLGPNAVAVLAEAILILQEENDWLTHELMKLKGEKKV